MFVYRRVKDLREDKDKTQREIAQYLNMQLTVYQRYERGERELPLWAAIRLADYYNVSLDYLVGRKQIHPIVLVNYRVFLFTIKFIKLPFYWIFVDVF